MYENWNKHYTHKNSKIKTTDAFDQIDAFLFVSQINMGTNTDVNALKRNLDGNH